MSSLPIVKTDVEPGYCKNMNLDGSKHLRTDDIPFKIEVISKDPTEDIAGSDIWIKIFNRLGGSPAEMMIMSTTSTGLTKIEESPFKITAVGVIESESFSTLPAMSDVSLEFQVHYELPVSETRPKRVKRLGEKGLFNSEVVYI